MTHLKKYFTEGLIQVAILLSLCGVRVDIDPDPRLPPSWQEIITGPTSALTPTHFHSRRDHPEDGLGPHPKTVDLDGFFTARRLLGWVRSLDRLQVPNTELETWLVHREPDHRPVGPPRPASPLFGARAGSLTAEHRVGLGISEEAQVHRDVQDVGGRRGDLDHQSPGGEPGLSPIIHANDLELHWQDLMAIMEPEATRTEDTDVDMVIPFDDPRTLQDVDSDVLRPGCNNQDADVPEAAQDASPLHHGSLERHNPDPLLLTPSAQLENHSASFETPENLNISPSPQDQMDPFVEDFSDDFHRGLDAENTDTFNMSLLSRDLLDNTENGLDLLDPERIASVDVNFNPGGLDSTSIPSPQLASVHLTDDDEDKDEDDGLQSPFGDLLDSAILDEVSLLGLALEEGFSPEILARLQEEDYLAREISQAEYGHFSHNVATKEESDDDKHSDYSVTVADEQDRPGRHQPGGKSETDSDSGLSLGFNHSPVSPCSSEGSCYSSSSDSSLASSFTDDDTDPGGVGTDMEVEVSIKQEEEEEELGAVGGYPSGAKLFPPTYGDLKMFNGFPWLEYIGHDHTYIQHGFSPSSPSQSRLPSEHPRSTRQHNSTKPNLSRTDIWSRDERRARAMKIPFSNELIVNMPVEDFNDLLANYHLNEEQLVLIRDIRRRGKNKIAAQNCRKRKLDTLQGMEDDVSRLKRTRLRLLREKREALRTLEELKHRLGRLYEEVFSSLRDKEGRPLDSTEYLLDFGPNGHVALASRRQRGGKARKKPKDKK